jgi:hypothetical protein
MGREEEGWTRVCAHECCHTCTHECCHTYTQECCHTPVLARRMPSSTSAMSWFVAFICSLCALRATLLSSPISSADATSFTDLFRFRV